MAPTNQQILDATKKFYAANQALVDTTTMNSNDVASKDKGFVAKINSNTSAYQKKNLTQPATDESSKGIFGETGGGGIFGPTLDKVKATDLFTTIGVGMSVEAVAIVGGLGGLGVSFDIAKRELFKGYGYATLEVGLKVAVDINIQAAIFNRLPSNLTTQIYGFNVGVNFGLGATFSVFYTGMGVAILGYAISIGIGVGGGAAVFGGKIWSFG